MSFDRLRTGSFDRPRTDGRATARAPGTCGELAQGMMDGIVCMVTCPIDQYSTATVELRTGSREVTAPTDSPKAKRAVTATLEYLDKKDIGGRLWLDSSLPRGKGMASSTADVAAAIAATGYAAGWELIPGEIAEIALGIEPSDGVMFPGVAVFDHRKGKVARSLGQPPAMHVVILDFGGSVNTEEFNREDRRAALEGTASQVKEAAGLIEEGIARGDAALIGRGATMSAEANQRVLFNPHLEAVKALAEETGAAGVNVAHSGTVIGLLVAGGGQDARVVAADARRLLPGLEGATCRRLVGGGVTRV